MNGEMPGERWSGLACEYYVNSIICWVHFSYFLYFWEKERMWLDISPI